LGLVEAGLRIQQRDFLTDRPTAKPEKWLSGGLASRACGEAAIYGSISKIEVNYHVRTVAAGKVAVLTSPAF